MGIKKCILDLVCRPLLINVWQTHLVEATGDNKYLKDVKTHNIIQSIQTEPTKTGSQDTKTGLLMRQIEPQWRKGIHTYSTSITKNEYELTKMGFTTDHAILFHHLKSYLEKFSQIPQGTSSTKLINNWDKRYGYGYKFTKINFNQLITNLTIADNKRRQTLGHNKAEDIIYGRTTEVTPHPMVLSRKEMFEKYFFAGVGSDPGINGYPPEEIETRHHINSSDD